ncbi:MAG TPA: DMT family transporter [Terriglobales bacterium]|jgi:drug/metabolite transporter (DMT)-like permease|nr:DMT family transporter [Terriglobales bacterium]
MRAAGWLNLGALVVVNLLWAAQYPAYKIAGDTMGAAGLNFWTLIFASLLLLPFWIRQKRERHNSEPLLKTVGEYLLLGLLGMLPPSVMLSWGIAHSSASNAAILSLTIPVLMTLLGVFMLKEKLTMIRIFSLMLGLSGTLLISTSDLARVSFNRTLLLGNLVILVAGFGSAFYNTYSKNLLSRYSELDVLLYSYAVGAAACAMISAATEQRPFYRVSGYSPGTWLAIGVLGVLSWGIAMILWMWVLNRLEVGQVSVSIYLLPFFGLLLSIVSVHERITESQIVGGLLTVASTATLTLFEWRRSNTVTEGHRAGESVT